MKLLRDLLEIIGGLSVLLLVAGAAWLAYEIKFGNTDTSKSQDARPILMRAGISANQDFQVIASYRSARSFTGDHLDYDCIQLSRSGDQGHANEWSAGPETNPILVEALKLGVSDAHLRSGCIPTVEEVKSGALKIRFNNMTLSGRDPYAADFFLYDPRDLRLYEISYKN